MNCPKCQTELSTGGGHGYHGLWFDYKYCTTCNEFVEWANSPLPDNRVAELKKFVIGLNQGPLKEIDLKERVS